MRRHQSETDYRPASFTDEEGRVHVRVENIGDRPPEFIKRRKNSTPVAFETVKPTSKEEKEKKTENRPMHRMGVHGIRDQEIPSGQQEVKKYVSHRI